MINKICAGENTSRDTSEEPQELQLQAVPIMTSEISISVDFTKTQKSRYFKNETLFFLQIKKFINYPSRATLWQK